MHPEIAVKRVFDRLLKVPLIDCRVIWVKKVELWKAGGSVGNGTKCYFSTELVSPWQGVNPCSDAPRRHCAGSQFNSYIRLSSSATPPTASATCRETQKSQRRLVFQSAAAPTSSPAPFPPVSSKRLRGAAAQQSLKTMIQHISSVGAQREKSGQGFHMERTGTTTSSRFTFFQCLKHSDCLSGKRERRKSWWVRF